jgi:acid phosphatase (class A)
MLLMPGSIQFRQILSFSLLAVGLAAAGAPTVPYFSDTALELTRFLAPPPAPGTADQARDLAELHRLEAVRTPAEVAYAVADQQIEVFRFADSLDPVRFKAEALPVTARFFEKVLSTGAVYYGRAKQSYHRPRPFLADTTLHPVLDKPMKSFSYPSGHSLSGNLIAIVLSDIVPEKRAAIMARGWLFAEHRALGGVHYPSDLQAGRISAALVAQRLWQDPVFLKDLEASRTEVRKALGLKP